MNTLYIVIGVALVVLIALVVVYLVQRKKAQKAAAVEAGEPAGAGNDEIALLIREAETRLAGAKLEQGARVSTLPAYILLGDSGAAKTSVMLHSGLEPELLAGQVYQNNNVASTRVANLWISRRSVFVEAGGKLPADAGAWSRLVKKLQPRASVVGKGEQAPRAAVVFFDCENFTRPGAADIVVNSARNLRARLGEISQAMGINLPVYVLFTKMDRLPFFTDYVRNLSNDEAAQVLGATLPMLGARAEGVYADEENARLTGNFERLFRALADARPEFLSREGDAAKLPPCYEFPREFRKIRQTAVQFLVELCRPSQLTVSPFLRGFYFTGVRPVIINEAAPVAPAAPAQQAGFGAAAGATGIFNARARAQAQPAAPQYVGTRKVPQWLFLTQFFNSVLLADSSALGASGASVKTSSTRRMLLAGAAALCVLLIAAFTISFFRNRALETRVRDAAAGISSSESSGADVASVDSLRKLETLRQSLETLVKYRREGAPWSYRWGLYIGDDLYPSTRRVYFDRFRQLLFAQTQGSMLQFLRGLPATPGPEYGPTYDALKAYLITTSHHDKSTKLFLAPVLNRWWSENRSIDPERSQLAQKQFEFYSEELKEENPYSNENDGLTIERARHYLAQFAGTERVYAFMLAEAGKSNPNINFNRQFPGSAQVVVETHEVAGAFSKGGWAFMKDAIKHADRYFNGEQWVLGNQTGASIDRAKLDQELKARYYSDFAREWREYVKGASVNRYAGLKDAAAKLSLISGNQSPLLALFCVASQNTAVDDPAVANIFQPIQTVVPPQCAERYIAPSNQGYMGALVGLQTSLEGIANQPGQPNEMAAAQTLANATQAKVTTRQMAQAFRLDAEGHVEGTAQKLLEDPIVYAEGLLRTLGPAEMNGKGRGLCAQIHPVLAKYPFSPNAAAQATVQEINAVFKPREGAIWQFYEANLQKAIMRQGSQFVANPSAGLNINGAFLGFLNRAAAFSDAAYPAGAADPRLAYSVKPVVSADTESIRLAIDGQTADYAGASAAAAKQFVWPGAAHGLQLAVKFKGGTEFNYPSYDGLWAVFQFVGDADKRQGSLIVMTLRGGKQGRPVLNPATNQPVTVRFEINANPPIFDRGYFSGFGCVAEIARP
jgi:type VI secretion system protein ImpL